MFILLVHLDFGKPRKLQAVALGALKFNTLHECREGGSEWRRGVHGKRGCVVTGKLVAKGGGVGSEGTRVCGVKGMQAWGKNVSRWYWKVFLLRCFFGPPF